MFEASRALAPRELGQEARHGLRLRPTILLVRVPTRSANSRVAQHAGPGSEMSAGERPQVACRAFGCVPGDDGLSLPAFRIRYGSGQAARLIRDVVPRQRDRAGPSVGAGDGIGFNPKQSPANHRQKGLLSCPRAFVTGGSANFLTRIAGPAFVLGGLIALADYGLDIAVGLATGQSTSSPQTSAVGRISSTLGNATLICYGFGLVGVARRLTGSRLALVSITIAGWAAGIGALNEVLGQGLLAAVGVLPGANLGAIIGGLVLLRARVEPRWIGWAVLLSGALFFPFIVATIPLAALLPEFVANNLPFPVFGIAWIAVGLGISGLSRQPATRLSASPA
jgi:hypothetical protein